MNSASPDQEPSTTTIHSFDDSDTRADEMREQLGAWDHDSDRTKTLRERGQSRFDRRSERPPPSL